MRTLLAVGWLNLRRDYIALGLTFVLPIVFFSIFSAIFGGMGEAASGGTKGIRVVLVDLDRSELSRRVGDALRAEPALTVIPGQQTPDQARTLVRRGEAPVAIVLPAGYAEAFRDPFGLGASGIAVELFYDQSDPIAVQIARGLWTKAVMTAAPDLMMNRGIDLLERYGGELTDTQRAAVDTARGLMRNSPEGAGGGPGAFGEPVPVRLIDVREAAAPGSPEKSSMVAYYAAGIGVMFLLFSMAGAAGSLLEEEESGALLRLLAGRVGMGLLLVGRWLFFALIGMVQITVMFVWGWLVFGLELFTQNRFCGFVLMAAATAAAAAGFGIMLATICRTRAQLAGISTVVILIMSALGGSMVPRFVMPPFMNTTALCTFNGWALDGFLKVFWFDDPTAGLGVAILDLLPQLAALLLMTGAFLLAARILARRWETA
jgi:ABC-2 type transport system permease protein